MVEERPDRLIRVLRFSNHADPLYCLCGHTWGHHGRYNRIVRRGHPGYASDCGGDGILLCGCQGFVYDYDNPFNKVVKEYTYWEAYVY